MHFGTSLASQAREDDGGPSRAPLAVVGVLPSNAGDVGPAAGAGGGAVLAVDAAGGVATVWVRLLARAIDRLTPASHLLPLGADGPGAGVT